MSELLTSTLGDLATLGFSIWVTTVPVFPPPLDQTTLTRHALSRGFTMIELICVIVILGVLAATAIPKFLMLRSDANIAAVYGMQAAMSSTLNMVFQKCAVSVSTCSVSAGYHSGTAPRVVIDGVTHQLEFGYPWYDRTGLGGGLPALMTESGFTDLYVGGVGSTPFGKDGAPDPINCSVTYQPPTAAGGAPRLTVRTTGC